MLWSQVEIEMSYIRYLFPLHLNTYVISLRPLLIFLLLQCTAEIDFRHQNPIKVVPRAVTKG